MSGYAVDMLINLPHMDERFIHTILRASFTIFLSSVTCPQG